MKDNEEKQNIEGNVETTNIEKNENLVKEQVDKQVDDQKQTLDENKEVKEKTDGVTQENKSPSKKKTNPLKIIGKLFNIVIWILIIVMLGILLLTVLSKRTDVFGYRLYTIMSGSMEPTIHVRDAVITQAIDDPQNGDVIAYENGNAITVHRIIKVYTEGENRLYETKGDNNNSKDDGLVQKTQIKGKVVARLPILGRTVLYLQSHFIIMILAVGILLNIILVKRLL